jgi:hypothetical protein
MTFSVMGAESVAPAGAPRFQAGDVLIVAAANARLMWGEQVVTAVPRGQRVVVVEVRDGWVGTHVTVNGQAKSGWMAVGEFLPSASPVAVCVCESRPAITADVEAFLIGRYQRHETDPDIHVWEPWRHY